VFDRQLAQALGMDRSRDISFVANRITRTGEKTARIDGDMTMNGRTHAETIDATFEGYAKSNLLSAKPRFGFSGHALIKRSDFGATNVILSTFAGDEVEILIEAEFEKA
jgi:polyisoprenoid-binding protein YceI